MAQPSKHPKTGIYQLRRVVPVELRAAVGAREFKRSLGTRDHSEAKGRFAAAWVESEQLFARAREQGKGAREVSQADAELLAARWFKDEQARLESSGAFTEYLAQGPSFSAEHRDRYEAHTVYLTLGDGADNDDQINWGEVVRGARDAALRLLTLVEN